MCFSCAPITLGLPGHAALAEAARYTAAADRKRLASEGMMSLEKDEERTNIVKPSSKI